MLTIQIDEAKEEGLIEGEKKGKEVGEFSAKLADLKLVIEQLYQGHDLSWLENCTLQQLSLGFNLLFNGLEYEELKNTIINS